MADKQPSNEKMTNHEIATEIKRLADEAARLLK